MATIKVRENESLDNALRNFKRKCSQEGILKEARKQTEYVKPSEKRKKKSEEARRNKSKARWR